MCDTVPLILGLEAPARGGGSFPVCRSINCRALGEIAELLGRLPELTAAVRFGAARRGAVRCGAVRCKSCVCRC
jgi:hypothetical protein